MSRGYQVSAERKCQAGCPHPAASHIRGVDGYTRCTGCYEGLGVHPFETLDSLRAEVEALQERLNGVLSQSVCTKCGWVGVPGPLSAEFAPLQWQCGSCTYQVPPPKSAIIADLREKLRTANTRASELFDELGIVQNEAQTQRGELVRQVAALTAERDDYVATIESVRAKLGTWWIPSPSPERAARLLVNDIENLEREIATLRAERDAALSRSRINAEKYDIAGGEITLLRQIALTDEALTTTEAKLCENHPHAIVTVTDCISAIRAARGVKEGG